MTIHWQPDLMTGLTQLDEQHLRIFNALKDLRAGIEAGQGHQVLGQVLSRVALLVEAHFRAEEKMMERTGYPECARHRKAHQEVRVQVEAMVDSYHAGSLDPSALLRFMEWWWEEHIRCEDQPLADYLKVTEAAG